VALFSQNNNGFTLIELMIVVAIVGILAAIGAPAYQDYTAKAQVIDAISLISAYKNTVVDNAVQDGICPSNGNAAANIPAAGLISSRIVNKVDIGGAVMSACSMAATMNTSNVNQSLSGKVITFTVDASLTVGSLTWRCSSNITQKLLPKGCVGA
jgi:type IV pilus assembly protein PilA